MEYFVFLLKATALLGLNIENRETFALLKEFYKYYLGLTGYGKLYKNINKLVNFDIFYELMTCWHCRF